MGFRPPFSESLSKSDQGPSGLFSLCRNSIPNPDFKTDNFVNLTNALTGKNIRGLIASARIDITRQITILTRPAVVIPQPGNHGSIVTA